MDAWRTKANRLIAQMCLQAYREANPKPKHARRIPKHIPYRVPQMAQDLVTCLQTNDERTAKAIFIRLAY